MPTFANKPGRDLALSRRNAETGRFDLDWDTTGDPKFDDTEAHRVTSLLVEHRPSAYGAGYWADPTGLRGSLLYTLRSLRASTPSQAEAYARDALQKAIDDGAIEGEPEISARKVGRSIELAVTYNARGNTQTVRASI